MQILHVITLTELVLENTYQHTPVSIYIYNCPVYFDLTSETVEMIPLMHVDLVALITQVAWHFQILIMV